MKYVLSIPERDEEIGATGKHTISPWLEPGTQKKLRELGSDRPFLSPQGIRL